MNKRSRGRPSISDRGSEVFSIRVPKGTAVILKTGFKTISFLSDQDVDPTSVILNAQLQAIERLSDRNSRLAIPAAQAIQHVLSGVERSRTRKNRRRLSDEDTAAV